MINYINLFLLTSVYSMNQEISKCYVNPQIIEEDTEEEMYYKKLLSRLITCDDNQRLAIIERIERTIEDKEILLQRPLTNAEKVDVENDEFSTFSNNIDDEIDYLRGRVYRNREIECIPYSPEYMRRKNLYDAKEQDYELLNRHLNFHFVARKKREYKKKREQLKKDREKYEGIADLKLLKMFDEHEICLNEAEEGLQKLEKGFYEVEADSIKDRMQEAINDEEEIEDRRANPWKFQYQCEAEIAAEIKAKRYKKNSYSWTIIREKVADVIGTITGFVICIIIYKFIKKKMNTSSSNVDLAVPVESSEQSINEEDIIENDVSEDVQDEILDDLI